MESDVVGVDIGTSWCAVAVVSDGDVNIVENDINKRTTPSCVLVPSYGTFEGWQFGESALRMEICYPTETISCTIDVVTDDRVDLLGDPAGSGKMTIQGAKPFFLAPQETFVVTRGGEGSAWYTADGRQDMPSVAPDAFVDSTGAGDSFVAGTLKGLIGGHSHETAARIGATVASFIIEKWGCQSNLPSPQRVAQRFEANFGRKLSL